MRTLLLALLLIAPAQAQDHRQFERVLQGYVQDGRVDYDGIRTNRRAELQQYVRSLGNVQPEKLSHDEQVAFWLNAYNALIVQLVVEGGKPTDSFDSAQFYVAGEKRTLDDIEHRALRPLAKDPRVHFALNCGAKSCPPLRPQAFLTTADLEKATVEFLHDPRNVTIDPVRKRLYLSKIFDWYAEDFGDVVKFVGRYRPELLQGKWDVEYRPYDWSLNSK